MTPYRKEVIGNCELYLADCLELLPTLGKFDAVVTDPPYGIDYAANPIVGKGKKASNHAAKEWDSRAVDLEAVVPCARFAIVWGGNYYDLPQTRSWLCWFKPDAPPSIGHFELAWTNLNRPTRLITQSIAATNAERVGHPTQKPLAVMEWCLTLLPSDTHYICDPFMGSGTTGVACAKSGRRFVGIEKDPVYFELACDRIIAAYRQPDMFVEKPKPAKQEALQL